MAEDRISALASEAGTLRGQLELIERKLIAIEQKASERQTLRPTEQATEAGPVEPVPSQLTPSEATPAHPGGSARDLSVEAKRSAESVAELSRRAIGEFKRVLASAGVDVARLFSRFGVNHAEGGPFVLPPRADQPAGSIDTDGLVMRGLARLLPLSTPLEHYQIGSRFGPRRDPFNGRAAFHSGLDFDAGYMSPVYATAPGIVT